MAKRKEEKPMEQLDLHELIKGTNIQIVSETSGVMHDRMKVPTPLATLNCIFGGGLPLGIMTECYGPPTSGKSSFAYQTMGIFQKTYPEGVSIVVDTEASVDSTRLPFMGCDPARTLRLPATTIEDGFEQLFALLDKKSKSEALKKLPVFIIYDTIAVQTTNSQLESLDPLSGGLMQKPRLLKHYLSCMLPYIEEQPITCLLLNQVTTEMNRYGSSLGSSGGWGLKHNIHLKLYFDGGKTENDGIFSVRKYSVVDIEKSKISPLFSNLSMSIDITKGGVIDEVESLINYCADQLGFVTKQAWCNCDYLVRTYPQYNGKFDRYINNSASFRYSDLIEYARTRPKLCKVFQLGLMDLICEKYSYQSSICQSMREKLLEEIEAPEPTVMEDGSIVDIWSGEVLQEAPKSTEEVANDATQGMTDALAESAELLLQQSDTE